MYSRSTLLIDDFVRRLEERYDQMYSTMDPAVPGILRWVATMVMEKISNSDALYHDVEHSMLVTLVGQEILRGKHLIEGGVGPREWLNVMVSLICHDIGYVRGICPGDEDGRYVIDDQGTMIELPSDATDAALTPYHVERGKLFVRHRFQGHRVVDAEAVASNIEHTRFPVPGDNDPTWLAEFPAIVRAADLIGQMADPDYLRKLPALFYEFEETGATAHLGYRTPQDLREGYPRFFWSNVHGEIAAGLKYLSVTHDGRLWMANLFAHVFAEEHRDALA
ncbi:hypothetical protein [Zavarzinia sp. CC-PAN008]|uniref:hypothetical protein n=1 Tax=Zavarzinia sp. CC-PAN008 TaxID=3243332 RepID=UPI003F74801C